MLRPQGYAVIFDPDAKNGVALEHETITCAHCQRIVHVKPLTVATVYLIRHRDGRVTEEPGAACALCGHRPICLTCWGRGDCLPWEKQMEAIEKEARRATT